MQRHDEASQPALQGIWLPLITPFCDGALDAESLATLVYYYSTTEIDGLILAATTGEGMTLSRDETEVVVLTAAGTAAGRLPLYLGLSGADTAKMAQQIVATQDWPIDGYLITCPYYVRPSQEGLYRHFAHLAAQSAKPIAVYNIPYRTGVNMTNDTLLRLATLGNIIGVKDCCADPAQSFDLIGRRPPGFSIMTGEDAQFFAALAQGADGGILAAAHVETEAFAAVRRTLLAGDRVGALQQWRHLTDLVALLFTEPNPAPIKHWLWCEGLIRSPELRLPMTEVSAGLAQRIAAAVAARRPAERQSA
jgi:4-hydroxy-tetrahydrodipicolinate synthase